MPGSNNSTAMEPSVQTLDDLLDQWDNIKSNHSVFNQEPKEMIPNNLGFAQEYYAQLIEKQKSLSDNDSRKAFLEKLIHHFLAHHCYNPSKENIDFFNTFILSDSEDQPLTFERLGEVYSIIRKIKSSNNDKKYTKVLTQIGNFYRQREEYNTFLVNESIAIIKENGFNNSTIAANIKKIDFNLTSEFSLGFIDFSACSLAEEYLLKPALALGKFALQYTQLLLENQTLSSSQKDDLQAAQLKLPTLEDICSYIHFISHPVSCKDIDSIKLSEYHTIALSDLNRALKKAENHGYIIRELISRVEIAKKTSPRNANHIDNNYDHQNDLNRPRDYYDRAAIQYNLGYCTNPIQVTSPPMPSSREPNVTLTNASVLPWFKVAPTHIATSPFFRNTKPTVSTPHVDNHCSNPLSISSSSSVVSKGVFSDTAKARTLYDQGVAYYKQKQFNEATAKLNAAQKIYALQGCEKEQSTCLDTLASCYRELGNIHSAIHYCQQALTLRQNLSPSEPALIQKTQTKLAELQSTNNSHQSIVQGK